MELKWKREGQGLPGRGGFRAGGAGARYQVGLYLLLAPYLVGAPAWMGTSPFFALLFYWSFRRTPLELFEAARLEGLNPLGIWARIAMPLARPTIVTVGVLTFVQYWSDFINPLLYLKSEQHYTLPVGL